METQYISLNMTPSGVNPIFHISQYDVGRLLGFYVYNGSEVVDLDDYTCTVEATRTDGTQITTNVITNNNSGIFAVTATMSNVADKYNCQLVIVDRNTNRVASLPFIMDVVTAALNGNDSSIYNDRTLYQQYNASMQGALANEANNRINADNLEKATRQSAVNTLQNNINAEATTRAAADAVLQGQIDNFVQLPSGSTAADAELANIRVKADGTSATTAGNAVREQFETLGDAIKLTSKKNICTITTKGIIYVAWNDGDTIVETANASYMGAIVDVTGVDYITLNVDWVGPSYSFFADANDKRISKVADSKTSDAGYVYSVPQGAVKAYISQNISNVHGPIFETRGVVVFSGQNDITTSTYTVANYPYNTRVPHAGILDSLEIPYANIKDKQTNLADGLYTAIGDATVSGNTATITAVYQGMETSDLEIADRYIKVSFIPVFNLQRCVLILRYYDTAWRTTSALQDLISGQENSITIDKTQYAGTKYRILVQAFNLTPDVTNTVTINNMEIYSCTDFSTSPYYDPEFTTMMEGMMDTLSDVHKSFTVKKDGSGDFDSLVEAINTACQYMDAVVYVGPGEWDVIDEFGEDYMNAVSSVPATWGLVLKNRIHLIGTAKTVIKAVNASGSTNFENIKTYFSVFNAGEKGFTLENINIKDENIRYSVHDDRGGSGPEPYTNKYIRCSMIHKNGKYSDCIGAGLGENQTVEIRGCYFEGDLGRTRLVYWHGNNNSQVTNALGKITVCDNYFAQDGTFKLTRYGQSDTDTIAYVSNNSFGTAPSVDSGSTAPYDNMRMVMWNNEVRTA